MSDDLVIREQATVMLFSVGPDGTVTHVDEAVLDAVAAALWRRLGNAAHPWATLEEPEKDAVRSIAQEVLTPLLRRLVAAR